MADHNVRRVHDIRGETKPESIELIARAWIQRADSVLLAREVGSTWYFLPGGHVEAGEPIEHAVVRELAEELAAEAHVHYLRGVVEHRYRDGGTAHHEVNFIFDVSIGANEITSQEDHLEFAWVDLADLAHVGLRPTPVVDLADRPTVGGPAWVPERQR